MFAPYVKMGMMHSVSLHKCKKYLWSFETEIQRIKCVFLKSQKDRVFLMVETTAYFEAYRYVLEGLQEQREDDLPFQR